MKKFTGVKALAFVSILSALCLILILVTTFTTGIGIILMLVLPLFASLVTLNVDYRFVFIYIVATLLMSFINIQLAIFVVLPSLISGTVFGVLIQKYVQGYFIIFINSIILLGLQILSTYLIDFIYNINLINTIGSFLKLNDVGFSKIYYLFLFVISLIETSLSYVIITNELKKFDYEFNEKKNQFIVIVLVNLVLIILTLISGIFIEKVSYLLVSFTYYFSVILAYYLFSFYRHKHPLFIQIPLYVISIIGIMVLLPMLDKEYRHLAFLIIPFSHLLTSLYIIIYQKVYRKSYLNESIFD